MIDGPDEDKVFKQFFWNASWSIRMAFFIQKSKTSLAYVMKTLPKPMSTAITKCSTEVIKFDVEVSAFGVYTYEARQSIMRDFNCINICVHSDFVMIMIKNVSSNRKVVFKFNSITNVYLQ